MRILEYRQLHRQLGNQSLVTLSDLQCLLYQTDCRRRLLSSFFSQRQDGFWKSLVGLFEDSKNERNFQEEMDLHRVYLALEYRRRKVLGVDMGSDPADVIGRGAMEIGVMGLRERVIDMIRDQVLERSKGMRGGTKGKRKRKEALSVRESGIEGAGMGVWVDGVREVGEVVALFPGLVYSREEIRDVPGYPNFGREADFLMCRYDGYMVDSRAWMSFLRGRIREEYNSKRKNGESLENIEWFSESSKKNPYALGHMVNHPPKGVAPNVMMAPVDVHAEADTFDTLPWGCFSRDGTVGDGKVRGLALVALREIEGEEVFVNYRLNPSVLGGLPIWYHPCDEKEDMRRWQGGVG